MKIFGLVVLLVVLGLSSFCTWLRSNDHPSPLLTADGVGDLPRHTWANSLDNLEWNMRSIVCVILTFTVSALANAGGVGGGGFLVPLFNLVLGLSLKGAMALSQAAITGGAVAAGVFALFNTHPLDSSKPLLDLDIALVVMPCLLLGVSLGVTANQVFPDWLLVIVLSVLLVLLSVRTMRSGIRLHRKEVSATTQQDEEQPVLVISASSEVPTVRCSHEYHAAPRAHHLNSEPSMPATPELEGEGPIAASQLATDSKGSEEIRLDSHPVQLEGSSEDSSAAGSPTKAGRQNQDGPLDIQQEILEARLKALAELKTQQSMGAGRHAPAEPRMGKDKEGGEVQDQQGYSGQTPFQDASQGLEEQQSRPARQEVLWHALKLSLLILIWAAFLALQLVKDRFYTCSRGYFAMYGTQAVLCLLASAIFICIWTTSHRTPASDAEAPLLPTQGPSHHSASASRLVASALAILVGGCICALCGLGGGMVLGPVMLELGLHPLVTASTSLLLVGASSSSASVEFALAGRLDYGWAAVFFAVCVVASVIGVAGIGRIVRASGKASIIVFLLVFVMLAGGILTAVFGSLQAIQDIHDGQRSGFLNICKI